MAVHMDYGLWTMEGPRASAHAPHRSSPSSPICRGEAKRVRRIGMRRFGSTSAKMPECSRWDLLAWEICVWHTGLVEGE